MTKKTEEFKNPNEYGYKGTEKVEIDGYQFREVLKNVGQTRDEEIYRGYLLPLKNIHPDTYQEATEKQIEAGEFISVPDIEALAQMKEPQVFITERGKSLLMLNLSLEQVHNQNMESGIATHVDALKAEFEKSKEPKLRKL